MTRSPAPFTLGDAGAALAVVLLWGLNFVAVKISLTVLPPFLVAGLRFAFVGACLAPFFRPRLEQFPGVALVAVVLGVGHFGLLFFGISGMHAATAAIITQLGVPFSVVLAWVVFGDRPAPWRVAGTVLAFGGVALLAGEPSLPHWGPLAAAVVAMVAWACSNVQVKRLGPLNPLALNGWMALLASPMLLGLSWLVEDHQTDAVIQAVHTPRIWAAMAFTAIGSSLVAYTCWYRLLARHAMDRVVPLTLLAPVVGVTGGCLLLGEAATWQKLVGGAITVAGVALVQFMGKQPHQRQ